MIRMALRNQQRLGHKKEVNRLQWLRYKLDGVKGRRRSDKCHIILERLIKEDNELGCHYGEMAGIQVQLIECVECKSI